MIRAVVDTNVLVSALLSLAGNEAMVVRAIESGTLVPILSRLLANEYTEVLGRPKFARVLSKVPELFALMAENSVMLEPAPCDFVSPDPREQAVPDCALAGEVDFIVTGNRRHFPGPFYGRTEVVSAGKLLTRLLPAP